MGFVHSNLIKNRGRVNYDLIDVTDWLPTFYHLAGGDVNKIKDKIDGVNVWDTIANGKKSPRKEVNFKSVPGLNNIFFAQILNFPKITERLTCTLVLFFLGPPQH